MDPYLIPLKENSIPKFSQILPKTSKILIFDIDNTLYCESTGLERKVIEQILNYAKKRGIPENNIKSICRDYSQKYGLALKGFIKHLPNVDINEFYDCVDGSVNISDYIKKDVELIELLAKCEYKMYCFTNACYQHANNVLKVLDISKYFAGVFYCEYLASGEFVCKPDEESYRIVEELLDGCELYFWDDNVRNVEMAKKRGWHASLINADCNIKSKLQAFYAADSKKAVVVNKSELQMDEIKKRFAVSQSLDEYEDELIKENKMNDK